SCRPSTSTCAPACKRCCRRSPSTRHGPNPLRSAASHPFPRPLASRRAEGETRDAKEPCAPPAWARQQQGACGKVRAAGVEPAGRCRVAGPDAVSSASGYSAEGQRARGAPGVDTLPERSAHGPGSVHLCVALRLLLRRQALEQGDLAALVLEVDVEQLRRPPAARHL